MTKNPRLHSLSLPPPIFNVDSTSLPAMDPTMEAARAHPSKIFFPKYALPSSSLRSKTAFENSDIENAYPGTPLLVTNFSTNIERELHNKALKIYERLCPIIFYDNEQ